MTQITVQFGV